MKRELGEEGRIRTILEKSKVGKQNEKQVKAISEYSISSCRNRIFLKDCITILCNVEHRCLIKTEQFILFLEANHS